MPWYIDIPAIFLSALVGSTYLNKSIENAFNQSVTTKDDYKISINHLIIIYKKYNMVGSASIAYLAMTFDTKRFGWKFISSLSTGMLFAYCTLGYLTESILSLPNLLVPISGVFIVCGTIVSRLNTDVQGVVNDSEKLLIETPDAYKEYGQYLSNPYKALNMFEKLREYERDWEIAVMHRDDCSKNTAKIPGLDEWIWKQYELVVRRRAKPMEDQIEHMAKTLFTDTPPDEIQSIIQSKRQASSVNSPSPIKVKVMDKANLLPPHIQEMKDIASSPTLPKEVTNQAKKIFDAYTKKEMDRAQKEQLEIDNAMIAIHTVKKYYDEEHRL